MREHLNARGIIFERWEARAPLAEDATQEDVLAAYDHPLRPYMEKHGYQTADVIRVHPKVENIDAIRGKFLDEHTHSEDEVRFFVEGKGAFWFNLERPDSPPFCLVCEAGDFISVPAGTKHWFDMGAEPTVTAIRVFSNVEGWVPNYTESGVSQRYNKPYASAL
ncbi:MAG: cupin [Myxococcota bacterium]